MIQFFFPSHILENEEKLAQASNYKTHDSQKPACKKQSPSRQHFLIICLSLATESVPPLYFVSQMLIITYATLKGGVTSMGSGGAGVRSCLAQSLPLWLPVLSSYILINCPQHQNKCVPTKIHTLGHSNNKYIM